MRIPTRAGRTVGAMLVVPLLNLMLVATPATAAPSRELGHARPSVGRFRFPGCPAAAGSPSPSPSPSGADFASS